MSVKTFYCVDTDTYWDTCIALVDMIAFFPSCEQIDFPELQGKPIAVTNGEKGTCIISSSYEARAFGIKTGMRLNEAYKLCPSLITRGSRPHRYAEISGNIMKSLIDISPDIYVSSIDECFIDLKPVLNLYKSVDVIAQKLREQVLIASGINCSIGISEGQLTAKFCSKNKGKTTIVPSNKIKEYIGNASIGNICGIGKNIEHYLNSHNVYKCKDIEKIPITVLTNRFGNLGKRLYSVCLGHDPIAIDFSDKSHKSMGHGKVTGGERDKNTIKGILSQLNERLSRRLRANSYVSNKFYVGYKTSSGWVGFKYKINPPTDNSKIIWNVVLNHFKQWRNERIYQLQITAIDLQNNDNKQLSLFDDKKVLDSNVDKIKDEINSKFGKNAVRTCSEMLADKSNMVPVIAFNFDANGKKNSL